MDKPVKQSNYTGVREDLKKVDQLQRAVDKDLQNLFEYTRSLPQPGLTTSVTISGTTLTFVNGVLTEVI